MTALKWFIGTLAILLGLGAIASYYINEEIEQWLKDEEA